MHLNPGLWLFIILIFGNSLSFAADCWSPKKEARIASGLRAESQWDETESTISEIHNLIWKHRHVIDPRLVYMRMFGETGGRLDPFLVEKGGTGYGLFQFTGSRYKAKIDPRTGKKKTYRKEVEELTAQGIPPRLAQVKYFFETYMADGIEATREGHGCLKKRGTQFARLSNLLKSTYLAFGNCSAHSVARVRQICAQNKGYTGSKACDGVTELLNNRAALPLCEKSGYEGSRDPAGEAPEDRETESSPPDMEEGPDEVSAVS